MSRDEQARARVDDIARFFFEIGYGACWADAFIANGEKAPFPLSDAGIDRAWEIAPEATADPAEFDRMRMLADSHRIEALRGASGGGVARGTVKDADVDALRYLLNWGESKSRIRTIMRTVTDDGETTQDRLERLWNALVRPAPDHPAENATSSGEREAAVEIEGSIYDGIAAALVRDGKTIAHVIEYRDAVEIAAALARSGKGEGR
ncbi:hypothetical protein EIK56_24930 [Sphingomonas sp. C8-2]|nr:hypothetical protein EIK56_24930 [Sphingomonas sp. C8-2]